MQFGVACCVRGTQCGVFTTRGGSGHDAARGQRCRDLSARRGEGAGEVQAAASEGERLGARSERCRLAG